MGLHIEALHHHDKPKRTPNMIFRDYEQTLPHKGGVKPYH